MILYVNGDSHSAGAEAVNTYCFAEDDSTQWALGRKPHPDNLAVSYGSCLSRMLGAEFRCDAESASSNSRIVRTTTDFINKFSKPDLLIIGWSTWEREEWWDQETTKFWQVNAGGIGDDWPAYVKERYKNWIVDLDYQKTVNKAHKAIHNFHLKLEDDGINHYFFTCYEPFINVDPLDWNGCYLNPYDKDYTYYNWCLSQGFKTVNSTSYHFGPDAHAAWAEFLYPQIVQSCLTKKS
jgi:hypothetical protein